MSLLILPINVNYLAVLVAAIAYMAIGFFWYGPVLGNLWMKEVGLKKETMKKPKATFFLIPFGGALIMSFVLANFIGLVNAMTPAAGMIIGGWTGIGFSATALLATFHFEGRSRELFLIDAGYHLVSLVIMGALLAGWR